VSALGFCFLSVVWFRTAATLHPQVEGFAFELNNRAAHKVSNLSAPNTEAYHSPAAAFLFCCYLFSG
jgi:hypothetical protein